MTKTNTRKLNAFEVGGYASGALGKSLQWNSVSYLLLYYLTDIIQLTPSIAGLIVFVSLVWAGVIDIPLSYYVDKYRYIYKSYRTLLLLTAPVSGLSYIMLFILPPLNTGFQFLSILFAVLFFRTCYSLIDIPHNALLSNLSQDSYERSKLSASRIFFNSLAVLLLAIVVGPLLANYDNNRADLFVDFSIYVGLFFILNIFFCCYSIRGTENLDTSRQEPPRNLRLGLVDLLKNKPLLIIFGVALFSGALVPAFVKLAVFYAETALGGASNSSLLLIALAFAQMASMFIWNLVVKIIDKRNAAFCAYCGIIIVCVVFYFVSPTKIASVAAFFFCFGLFIGGIQMLIWSLLPDTVEYGENQNGVRNEALTFGSFQLVIKVGDGINVGLLGLFLGLVGYGSGLRSDIDLASNIASLMLILPIIGALVCMALLKKYPLTKESHALLNENLT